MAYIVMADIIMAYIIMAYIVIAYIVMAYIVMALVIALCSYGLIPFSDLIHLPAQHLAVSSPHWCRRLQSVSTIYPFFVATNVDGLS